MLPEIWYFLVGIHFLVSRHPRSSLQLVSTATLIVFSRFSAELPTFCWSLCLKPVFFHAVRSTYFLNRPSLVFYWCNRFSGSISVQPSKLLIRNMLVLRFPWFGGFLDYCFGCGWRSIMQLNSAVRLAMVKQPSLPAKTLYKLFWCISSICKLRPQFVS
jgi:hypothetical protein